MTMLPPLSTARRRPLRVAEVFGPTVQGEGPSVGRVASFVRLWGCNLDCAWCDTPFTWDTTGKNGVAYNRDDESRDIDVDRLVEWLNGGPRLVVVTGGEPLVQASALQRLCAALNATGHVVEIETNGTLRLPGVAAGVTYNISPKLAHSGVAPSRAIRPDVLNDAARRSDCRLKFVCRDAVDVLEAVDVLDRFGIARNRAWIMPEGRTSEAVHAGLVQLADIAITNGLNLSPRLHVTCWEDERAR